MSYCKTLFGTICTFLLLLNACDSPVTFDKPQPEGVSTTKTLPEKLHGFFISADMSDTLIVKSNSIILHLTYENIYLKSELDSNQIVKGDTLIDLNSDYKEIVESIGDTLISRIYETDTLYFLNRGDVMKKYKGHYLLNEFYSETMWEVTDMVYINGNIMLSKIDDPREIQLLKTVTQSSNDSTRNFSASKKQFKEFLANGGFGAGDIYFKIGD